MHKHLVFYLGKLFLGQKSTFFERLRKLKGVVDRKVTPWAKISSIKASFVPLEAH